MPLRLNILPLAATADATGSATGGTLSMIIMLVVMVAVFYFMIIRPENKKKKEAENMRSSLKVGDEITTIGGIVGTICAVKEKTIVLETGADRVRIEFTKWAISSKGTQATEEPVPDQTEKGKKKKKSEEESKDTAKQLKDGKADDGEKSEK